MPSARPKTAFKIRVSAALRYLLVAAALLLLLLHSFHRSRSLHMEESGGDAKLMTDLLDVVTKLEQEHEELHTAISALESGAIGPESIDLKAVVDEKRQKAFTESISAALDEAAPMSEQQQQHSAGAKTKEEKKAEERDYYPPSNVYPAPLTFSSGGGAAAMLVVGGTDGSGTRRVVQTLASLGVLMVSEDPETFDIHADAVGGWPPVVSPVVRQTKSLQYSVAALPPDLRAKALAQLKQLVAQAERDSTKPTSHTLAVGGALPRPKGMAAAGVSFGFKAPVAMTLAPFWAALAPAFKLLHVLRDGRDIAFSANQGPVNKFFNDMYNPSLRAEPQEMAIRLWSDWNAQIYKWAEAYAAAGAAGKPFGYYAMHSEDLVSEDSQVRFAAIHNLARWVGSSASNDEVCCLAMRGSAFMGSHDRTPRAGGKGSGKDPVSGRYGKWRGLLEKNAPLRERLQRAGAEGLRVFGYEPLRTLAAEGAVTADGEYQCRFTSDQCSQALKPDVKAYSAGGACEAHGGRDYGNDGAGSDLSSSALTDGEDAGECCRRCRDSPLRACRFFTVDTSAGVCYLKSRQGVIREGNAQLVSGDVVL